MIAVNRADLESSRGGSSVGGMTRAGGRAVSISSKSTRLTTLAPHGEKNSSIGGVAGQISRDSKRAGHPCSFSRVSVQQARHAQPSVKDD